MHRPAANLGKQAAKRRTGHKADADGGAEKPHIFGPFFRG